MKNQKDCEVWWRRTSALQRHQKNCDRDPKSCGTHMTFSSEIISGSSTLIKCIKHKSYVQIAIVVSGEQSVGFMRETFRSPSHVWRTSTIKLLQVQYQLFISEIRFSTSQPYPPFDSTLGLASVLVSLFRLSLALLFLPHWLAELGGHLMTFIWPYFSSEAMMKFTTRPREYFVVLIVNIHLITCTSGQKVYLK